jgi:DNA-binding CsgD family transcriptional regulator
MEPSSEVRSSGSLARRSLPIEAFSDTGRQLTARERDIVSWLAGGHTDRQIASQLGLSHRTVHKHLEHVYRKLGVASRTAAVVCVAGLFDRR